MSNFLPKGSPTLAPMDAMVVIGILLGYFIVDKAAKTSRRPPLPPGPKGIPFIGNLFAVPARNQCARFKEWSQIYDSNLISLRFLNTTIIIVNTATDCHELFDKRASTYSNRPVVPMIELMDFGWSFPFHQYGTKKWRAGRTLFRQEFDINRPLIHPIESKAALNLVKSLLGTHGPVELNEYFRQMAGEVILTTAYGIQVQPHNDPNIERAETVVKELAAAFNPASFLVNLIPSLRFVPEWFPGAGWKIKVKKWRQVSNDMRTLPFRDLQRDVAAGTNMPCVGSRLLADIHERGADPDELDVLSSMLGTMFGAGSDTTVSALLTFVLAMLHYPEVQSKAQRALETVTHQERFPTFQDQGKLPYIEALVRETLRWCPVGPIGAPHVATQDDVYNGYLIPKGAILLGNSSAILRDETIFGPDTSSFRPDRFLDPDGSLKHDLEISQAFGYGRRICPGQNMARDSIWINICYLLTVFDFTTVEGDIPVLDYTTGLIVFPKPYRCKVTPRSNALHDMVLESKIS